MKSFRQLLLALASLAMIALFSTPAAAALSPEAQARVTARIAEAEAIAADPAIVAAVVAQNAGLTHDQSVMTQSLWSVINNRQSLVQSLMSCPAAHVLRTKTAGWANEAFLSDRRGLKVALLGKTTNWCHAGMPKHEIPMSGHTWQGPIAIDASTGTYELQVSAPVLKDGVPVGSLVVGLDIGQL